MEFNEKLQELRKQKGLTQEELSEKLYVSRTAISKWESGRGYPNIESLKAIAKFFSLTLDELLSTSEILTITEEENKRKEKVFLDLLYGLLDLSSALLLFLPFFAENNNGIIQSVSLLALNRIQPYLKIIYFIIVIITSIIGLASLALQNIQINAWIKSKVSISLSLGAILVLVFIISSQVYAAIFAFVLLIIKTLMLIKKK